LSADRTLAMNAFLTRAGWADAERVPLPGDASTRRYMRLKRGGDTALLMDQPQGEESPDAPANATPAERQALGYNAIARLAGSDCGRFIAAANYLRTLGLSSPEIYAEDAAKGFVLIEDLGDDLYADVLAASGDETALYRAAADVLAKLHARGAPSDLSPGKPLYAYDETALIAEAELLPQWFIPLALGRDASADELAEHRALWRDAIRVQIADRRVFVHRDYHAQNLIWLPGRNGAARVGLIDFQDAVAGPMAYDLISLVEDARRDVDPALAELTTARYLEAMAEQGTPLHPECFSQQKAVFAAQRNAKIVGIFARLFKRDGKPRYLDYLPRVWGYLDRDLEHPALEPLKAWYDRAVPHDARSRRPA